MFDKNPKIVSDPVAPAQGTNVENNGDRKQVRYLDQIFDPDIHPLTDRAKYVVPNEGELVHDTVNHRILIVKHVDKYATWKTTFENYWLLPEESNDDYDLFPQHEYGFLQGELAFMIDYSERPPVARVDSNATGNDAAYAIVYKGSLISELGQVVSATYEGQNFIDKKISVSPVIFDNIENRTVMGCNSFSTTQNEAAMPNGTKCTLVYYDIAGRPIPPTYPLVVQQCAYMRDHQLSTRYVKNIELVAPWFTNSMRPRTMFVPINLPLTAIEFRARVHFSDGSSEEHPVNSISGDYGFTIHGIDQYKPTTPNQVSDAIVLTYAFKESEQALIVQPGSPRHMSESYEIVATPAQGAYSPRIYSYPYWDATVGWRNKHFTTDLDRKYCRDVTDITTLNESSPVFNGKLFGEEQPMIFNLNMRDVSAIYEPWAFVQHTTITLYNPPTNVGRKWDVRHSYSRPPFQPLSVEYVPQTGGSILAKFAGLADVTAFVAEGYLKFEPMFDPRTEIKAPDPTHFDLVRVDGTARTGIPIASFNSLPINDLSLADGETLYIRWVRRDSTGAELQLGVSAALTKQVTVFS